MADRLTDAELVERLKLLDAHGGNAAAAARTLGVPESAFRTSLRQAKAKGLTSTTEIVSVEGNLRARVKLLEHELDKQKRENETAEALRTQLFKIAENSPEPPEWLTEKRSPKSPGIPLAVWSDFHWGEIVNPDEVGGVNAYNREIARARFSRLVDGVVDLAYNHMVNPDYPGIVICLGGDMISGNIHEELRETNDGYVQVCLLDLEENLIAGLRRIADHFGRVFVVCVVGNHGRTTVKPKMKGRVFENYEWGLYVRLERFFQDDPRFSFYVPNETDAHFAVYGHRFLLTHGDSLGVKGGDGIIGSLGPIMRGTIKVHHSEAQIGRDFDTIIMGHWHDYMPILPRILVNGSLKGYDEYARLALRARYDVPTQALIFVHPKYGPTASWPVFLEPRISLPQSGDILTVWRKE